MTFGGSSFIICGILYKIYFAILSKVLAWRVTLALTQIKKNHDNAVCGLDYHFNKTANKCYHKCRQEKQFCDVHGDCYVDSEGKPRCV